MRSDLIQMTVELSIGFFALLMIMKLLGRTQIKQLTPFDFVSSIVLSELLGNAVYSDDAGILHVLYALALWGTLMFCTEKIMLRSLKLDAFFVGKPAILIYDGQIDYEALRKHRLTIQQLQGILRQSETFSMREVQVAILETNGSVSILKKHYYQKTTVGDLKLPVSSTPMPITLILEGDVLRENLQEAGYDEAWLTTQLAEQGFHHVEEVLFAEWLQGDGLFVVRKEEKTTRQQSVG